MGGNLYRVNKAKGCGSVVIGGSHGGGQGSGDYQGNVSCGTGSAIIGGCKNTVGSTHHSSIILGENLTSNEACTTFVNNMSTQCNLSAGGIINSFEGFRIGEGTIKNCTGSFTLSLSDNGKTLFLDTTSGTINVTTNCLISGFNSRFIKSSGASPVVFGSGHGLSGLNSYLGNRCLNVIYSQADIFYCTDIYAFLGGNLS